MVFTKDGLLRLLITIIISIVICALAALVLLDGTITFEFLLKSAILGSSIWLVSEIATNVADRLWPHNIVPSYVVMCIIIITGTSLGLWVLGLKEVDVIVLVNIIAVLGGLTIAIVSRKRYKAQLNKQLKEFKEKQ